MTTPKGRMRFYFWFGVVMFNYAACMVSIEVMAVVPSWYLMGSNAVTALASAFLVWYALDWFTVQAELERLEAQRRFIRELNRQWSRESAIRIEREFLEGNDGEGFPLGKTDWN